jgi:hypothetical protein
LATKHHKQPTASKMHAKFTPTNIKSIQSSHLNDFQNQIEKGDKVNGQNHQYLFAGNRQQKIERSGPTLAITKKKLIS